MPHLVFFDLEATGLGRSGLVRNTPPSADVEIIEIGAVFGEGYAKKTFQQHVVPACDIEEGATRITGMSKRSGQLYLEGRPVVEAVDPRTALVKFHEFLKSICGGGGEKVVLVGHSCLIFDSWVLCHNLKRYKVDMSDVVDRFLDTHQLAYDMGVKGVKLSMSALVQYYLHRQQPKFHSAAGDAQDLQDLTKAMAKVKGLDHQKFCMENWTSSMRSIAFKDSMGQC